MISYRPGICASFASVSSVIAIVGESLFQRSFAISLSGAVAAYLVAVYEDDIGFKNYFGGLSDLFGSVQGVLGFLLVFRMGQAYQRFQTGSDLVFAMVADFGDATSILVSLARGSKAAPDGFRNFTSVIVRLVSLLSAVCFSGLARDNVGDETEEGVESFLKLYGHITIDLLGLDDRSLHALARSKCKPELAYQMIQQTMVDNLGEVLAIPPPLLTRVFQELGTGMINYHEAFKLVHVPYPFPLMALLEMGLVLHWCLCPFVFALWCDGPGGSAIFTFFVEFILWSMLALAAEFDNPFGKDANDIDALKLQQHLNHSLASLIENSESPSPKLCISRAEVISTELYKPDADFEDGIVRISRAGWRTSVHVSADFTQRAKHIASTASNFSDSLKMIATGSLSRRSQSHTVHNHQDTGHSRGLANGTDRHSAGREGHIPTSIIGASNSSSVTEHIVLESRVQASRSGDPVPALLPTESLGRTKGLAENDPSVDVEIEMGDFDEADRTLHQHATGKPPSEDPRLQSDANVKVFF